MDSQKYEKSEIPIIYIEGGIGCGKSTLVKKIQEYCNDNQLNIVTIQEPVDIWMSIIDENSGKNMIEAFYENQEKYSFPFQMMAYISRLQRLHETMRNLSSKSDIIICERSLDTDKNVFCKMLYDEGKIDSFGYQIYNKWFDYFKLYDNRAKYVYLKTNHEICFQRVNHRNRNGEGEIPLEYLKKNNEYHDDWLLNEKKDKILILDGNNDAKDNPNTFDAHIQAIFEKFINTN